VLALRDRQRRNLLTTLLLSEGVPLILGGDELGRTQRGNNNAYCQDNEISWIDWRGIDPDPDLTGLVARLCRLRRNSPLLRRGRFLSRDELTWLRPDGAAMTDGDWANPDARAIVAATPGARLLVNACWEPLTFSPPKGEGWSLELDTTELKRSWAAGTPIELAGRSLVLLARADGAPQ
jgi:glycogen operon protein